MLVVLRDTVWQITSLHLARIMHSLWGVTSFCWGCGLQMTARWAPRECTAVCSLGKERGWLGQKWWVGVDRSYYSGTDDGQHIVRTEGSTNISNGLHIDSMRSLHSGMVNTQPSHSPFTLLLKFIYEGSIIMYSLLQFSKIMTPAKYHQRHEPILVADKTLTKSSTYVNFVIKFVGITNLTNILNFREPLNN